MNDIRKQDWKLFIKELLRPGRVLVLALSILLLGFVFQAPRSLEILLLLFASGVGFATWIVGSYNGSIRKRFHAKKYEALWNGCRDRLSRFDEVLGKMRREQVADLHDMPRTIRRVGDNLYAALRRADMISHEVSKTEQPLYMSPPIWQAPSTDPQAKELYRIADKNIAEYRAQFAGVMAGVHRAEAQSAVFMTTLDSLRMKMIGYRLVGKSPEMSSRDFLEALGEAKLQLNAIDQALDELDFSAMPKMIAVSGDGE